jgi:serine/threonine-protein phosphatase 4 regulatory subunit 1
LSDADESVRLSTIRNFPALLKLLPAEKRAEPFAVWAEVATGEDMLGGGKKRSPTNPVVLNWRQRDYLARSLTELVLLVQPESTLRRIWPLLQTLLTDGIDIVRDDALWAIPVLLASYCPDTLSRKWGMRDAKRFSADAVGEVISWIHGMILRSGPKQKQANFCDRQLYCRICAAIGLALRYSEYLDASKGKVDDSYDDPVSVMNSQFKSYFKKEKSADDGPYQKLTSAEQKHLRRLLVEELLPPALPMKEDRISNVRITLMRGLQIMPYDIRSSAAVKSVLKDLEDESETWTSFGAEENLAEQLQQLQAAAAAARPQRSSGPVDVDAFSDEGQPTKSKSSDSDASSESSAEKQKKKKKKEKKATEEEKDVPEFKVVVFEDGPIGMQLEPTEGDTGCRVCGFLDAEDGTPSPARVSGKIAVGDVILRVNKTSISSYDDAIAMLKAGGRRKIVFRPGRPEDEPKGSDEDDEEVSKTKKAKKEKKHRDKKKAAKRKKEKKEKREKKREVMA